MFTRESIDFRDDIGYTLEEIISITSRLSKLNVCNEVNRARRSKNRRNNLHVRSIYFVWNE